MSQCPFLATVQLYSDEEGGLVRACVETSPLTSGACAMRIPQPKSETKKERWDRTGKEWRHLHCNRGYLTPATIWNTLATFPTHLRFLRNISVSFWHARALDILTNNAFVKTQKKICRRYYQLLP
jgi:hypothetical protein